MILLHGTTRGRAERLQQTFTPDPGGVVGLVDRLLALCQEQGLRFDWQAHQCRVRLLGVEPPAAVELPLPKSVFRAILARLAVLCNERRPNAVTPYGGRGEISSATDPHTVLSVAFTNTPTEQGLELKRVVEANGETDRPMTLNALR